MHYQDQRGLRPHREQARQHAVEDMAAQKRVAQPPCQQAGPGGQAMRPVAADQRLQGQVIAAVAHRDERADNHNGSGLDRQRIQAAEVQPFNGPFEPHRHKHSHGNPDRSCRVRAALTHVPHCQHRRSNQDDPEQRSVDLKRRTRIRELALLGIQRPNDEIHEHALVTPGLHTDLPLCAGLAPLPRLLIAESHRGAPGLWPL